jgi:hypothetical protein
MPRPTYRRQFIDWLIEQLRTQGVPLEPAVSYRLLREQIAKYGIKPSEPPPA